MKDRKVLKTLYVLALVGAWQLLQVAKEKLYAWRMKRQ
jgi:hypothetical protein